MVATRCLVPLVFCASIAGQDPEPAALFDRVGDVLAQRFFDRGFVREELPRLLQRYRPAAATAASPAEERAVVGALLAEVPASHLALLSAATYERFEAEIAGRRAPTLGFDLVRLGGRFFVDAVFDAGAAAAAGLRAGDEVLAIDGEQPGRSPRLDWSSDDAHLPDPPTHDLLVADGDRVAVTIAGAAGTRAREVAVVATRWSGYDASRASVRELRVGGRRLLYLHLWFVFHGRAGRLCAEALADHEHCDGLLLDLRGRGGSALECPSVVRAVDDAATGGIPCVALIDGRTRSAKEVIADELQQRGLAVLVGEHTAGAVLPASFAEVGDGAVLMFPEHRLGAASKRLEGRGVAPEIAVTAPLPPVPGEDPILAAAQKTLLDVLGAPSGR